MMLKEFFALTSLRNDRRDLAHQSEAVAMRIAERSRENDVDRKRLADIDKRIADFDKAIEVLSHGYGLSTTTNTTNIASQGHGLQAAAKAQPDDFYHGASAQGGPLIPRRVPRHDDDNWGDALLRRMSQAEPERAVVDPHPVG